MIEEAKVWTADLVAVFHRQVPARYREPCFVGRILALTTCLFANSWPSVVAEKLQHRSNRSKFGHAAGQITGRRDNI
jgi:hypothetical protein